jgi:dTDP-glucose 4,6-dehydratase
VPSSHGDPHHRRRRFHRSNFIHAWFGATDEPVINVDRLTYAGNMQNLAGLPLSASQRFVHMGAHRGGA